jgi:hypothetical protein
MVGGRNWRESGRRSVGGSKRPGDEWRVEEGSVQKCPGGGLSELDPSGQAPPNVATSSPDHAQHCANSTNVFGLVVILGNRILYPNRHRNTQNYMPGLGMGYARSIVHMTPLHALEPPQTAA